MLSNQNPSILYRLIDLLGNNHIWGYIYKKYISQIGLAGNEHILDFGSGSGAGSKHLVKVLQKGNGRLTCNDISGYWMNIARKRLRHFHNVDFALGQLPELRLQEGSFDVVYIHYALHEVPEDLRSSIVLEFYRLLKRSGRLCIKEPKREGDGMPSAEVRSLLMKNGFAEQCFKDEKGYSQGIYIKPVK